MLAGVTMRVFGENRQDVTDVNASRLSQFEVILAGVTMRVFGEDRLDLSDVNARRLSGLK